MNIADTTPATVREARGVFTPELLDRCISCGFCLPACPTYALTRDEGSSPRGRITLMRALETGRLDEDDDRLQTESSFCLGCRACEPVCPAGVQYGHLLETWRDHQWRGVNRPPLARALELDGTITGEHGIGIVKLRYLERQLGAEHMALLRRIKAAFDPAGILNPGKLGS